MMMATYNEIYPYFLRNSGKLDVKITNHNHIVMDFVITLVSKLL